MSMRMSDREFEGILPGSDKTSRFFRAAAIVTLVIGIIGSLIDAWTSTHIVDTATGRSSPIDHAFLYFVQTFVFDFGGVCLVAASMFFCAFVLDLLRANVT